VAKLGEAVGSRTRHDDGSQRLPRDNPLQKLQDHLDPLDHARCEVLGRRYSARKVPADREKHAKELDVAIDAWWAAATAVVADRSVRAARAWLSRLDLRGDWVEANLQIAERAISQHLLFGGAEDDGMALWRATQCVASTIDPSERRDFLLDTLRSLSMEQAEHLEYVRILAFAAIDRLQAAAEGAIERYARVNESGGPVQEATTSPLHWDANCRVLWVDGQPVKRYARPAPHAEALLGKFEKMGWPSRIDDPLPAGRLAETLRTLNQALRKTLLRFERDGTGRGVRWRRVG
jgi:hypothetical protein